MNGRKHSVSLQDTCPRHSGQGTTNTTKTTNKMTMVDLDGCYDIKPVRKEKGKSYWEIPLCDDDATREK